MTWPERRAGARTGAQAAARTGARSGRRAGDSGTREAILSASRAQFAEHGYDGATIRAIARAAGVDPALVHHYYGGKENLFAAAMQLPFIPSEVITAALTRRDTGDSLGTHMVATALSVWESAEVKDAFQTMLRSALTSEHAAATLREFITEAILRPVASAADDGVAERTPFRASLVATQMLGLAVSRYVLRFEPVAAATPDELAAAIGPTIDRYLTGAIDARNP
jgi:AcrR family transcriptional regulator